MAAKKQNAFVFWNHPAWYAQSPSGNPVLSDFQEERIKNGELHGIEVINSYSTGLSPVGFVFFVEIYDLILTLIVYVKH